MENCFIVTDQSKLHKEYFDYRNNIKIIDDIAKKLMEKHNIQTKFYYANNESFAIQPTDKDTELLNKMLKVPIEDGVRFFKKNSKVNKDWLELLKSNDVKVLRKPFLMRYFNNVYGKIRSRLFDVDGILYCSIECENVDDIKCPEGMERIKTSEFYKIVEDNSDDKNDVDK